MRCWLTPLFLLALQVPVKAEIRGCISDVPNPPFGFLKPNSAAKQEVGGLGVDVLQAALKRSGLEPATISVLPWQRCLRLVEAGSLDIVLNVPTAQVNPAPYFITEPYYTVHSVYFFSTKLHPKGIDIVNLDDLNRHKVCGLLGYSFDGYGLDSSAVDTGSKDYASLIRKLNAGRCDLFIDKKEIIESMYRLDPQLQAQMLATSLVSRSLPEEMPMQFHFAISRRKSGAEELRKQLDTGVAELTQRGEVTKMMTRYLR
ncbi:substrate-binding periplasmic protein [Chitinimonas sp. PSY-7]|uniref:transporter substrate-binding domain-containing protein n=1 Tax=Chitinimonas sp. PSY-7 TaxID=3459088 RepID=UPI00403FFA1F